MISSNIYPICSNNNHIFPHTYVVIMWELSMNVCGNSLHIVSKPLIYGHILGFCMCLWNNPPLY